MIDVLDRRRSRAFDDAVRDRSTHTPGIVGELLGVVDALAAVEPPTLDAEVRQAQRALLLAEFERRGAHRAVHTLTPGTRLGRRLGAAAIAATIVFGALGGATAASTSSLPGDTLYGLKRQLEDLQYSLAGSDMDRGRLLLDDASTRLSEVRALLDEHARQRVDPAVIGEERRALTDLVVEASRGRDLLLGVYQRSRDLGPLLLLAGFANTETTRLAQVEARLPHELDAAVARVRQLLDGIRAEIAVLLPADGSKLPAGVLPSSSANPSSAAASPAATSGASGGGAPGPASSATPAPSATGSAGTSGGTTGGAGAPAASPTVSVSVSAPASGSGGAIAGVGVTLPPLLPGLPTVGVGLIGGNG